MATQTTANWPDSVRTDLKEWTINGYEKEAPLYPGFFKTETTTRGYEEFKNSDTVGYPTRTAETVGTTKTAPVDGYKTVIETFKFKQGIDVSEEEYNRDQYGLWEDKAMGLGEAAMIFKDVKAFSLYRNGFTTAKSGYGDGVAFFSTKHPTKLVGGSTQSNASATGAPLNPTNLFTGLLALVKQHNYSEKPLMFRNKKVTLMVPEDQWENAFTIVNSVLKSGSAENDTNFFYKGINMELVVNPYIGEQMGVEDGDSAGSTTAWFLICKDIVRNVMLQEKGLTFNDKYDAENDVMSFYAKELFNVGAKHYLGQWGSKGDNAAYSD